MQSGGNTIYYSPRSYDQVVLLLNDVNMINVLHLTSQLSGSKNSFFFVANRNSSKETSLSLLESTCQGDGSKEFYEKKSIIYIRIYWQSQDSRWKDSIYRYRQKNCFMKIVLRVT